MFTDEVARVSIVLFGLAIGLVTWASDAAAATVEVRAIYQKANHTSDGVYLRAAPGEVNDVTIAQAGPNTIAIADSVPLEAGPGCTSRSTFEALCTTTPGVSVLIDVRLRDGDDGVRAAGVEAFPAKLFGGPGDDHLVGLTSGLTRFSGGRGDDLMEGGPWGDTFLEDDRRDGSDTMLGGSPGSVT